MAAARSQMDADSYGQSMDAYQGASMPAMDEYGSSAQDSPGDSYATSGHSAQSYG